MITAKAREYQERDIRHEPMSRPGAPLAPMGTLTVTPAGQRPTGSGQRRQEI